MSHLTENEVLSRLKDAMGDAIQASNDLAVNSREGEPYGRLRDNLALIEGCCRQMAAFRGDSRWLPFGIAMAECHKRSGGWLRGYEEKGIHISHTKGALNKAFVKLSAELTVILNGLDEMFSAKTGVVGPILPPKPAAERRIGAPVRGHRISQGGIIIPPGASLH